MVTSDDSWLRYHHGYYQPSSNESHSFSRTVSILSAVGNFSRDSKSSVFESHAGPRALNSSTLSHILHDGGKTWKAGSFCEDFLERRYHTPVQVCSDGGTELGPQIQCYWNPLNEHAATCDIDEAMIRPNKLWTAMENVEGTFPHSGAVGLLESEQYTCHKPTIDKLVSGRVVLTLSALLSVVAIS